MSRMILTGFARTLFALTLLVSTAAQAATVIGNNEGRIEWNGWELDYFTFTKDDGLTLHNVTYDGLPVLGRASFPVMSVYYEGDACGPYADKLNGPAASVSWADDAVLVARQFTQNGRQWFELGIREFIGSYDIYQVWYLSAEGELNAHLFSRGLQCETYHEHYPMWRLDFDIDGPANDQILMATASGQFDLMSHEFELPATDAYQHGWHVQDSVTGSRIDLLFDNGDWSVDTTSIPETEIQNNTVGGMLNRSTEEAWPSGPSTEFPHDNGEAINNEDLVVWYRGYLPHSPDEGAALWHSTGIQIATNVDSDGDGIINTQDPDDDNDGVNDGQDQMPLDPTEVLDTDQDGIGNIADTDDDNDGVADSVDLFPLDAYEAFDIDADGIGDNADEDHDNDGIPNRLENGAAKFSLSTNVFNIPQRAGSSSDTIDLSSVNAIIGQQVQISNIRATGDLNSSTESFKLDFNNGEFTSGDLATNAQCQPDMMAVLDPVDVTLTVLDIGNGTPGLRVTGTTSSAVDNFGDCQGVSYSFTVRGLERSIDTDNDGVANARDLDSDNDSITDVIEAGGTDADNDGLVDNLASAQASLASPVDQDGDTVPDFLDLESNNAGNDGSNYDIAATTFASLDTNGDGRVDAGDTQGGSDVNGNGIDDAIENAVQAVDTDNDGIPDDIDTDDDNDGVEDTLDAFPLDPAESVDTDGDGIGNNADTDDDNDGVADSNDLDPLDPTVGEFPPDSELTELIVGQNQSNSVSQGEWKQYLISNLTVGEEIIVRLTGLTDDLDLYLHHSASPDLQNFSCSSTRGGSSDEHCTVSVTQSQQVYVAVHGYRAAEYTLSAEISTVGNPGGTISPGENVQNELAAGEWLRLKVENPESQTNLTAVLDNLSSDLDLYVSLTGQPSTTSYDCRSWASGTTVERCVIPDDAGDSVYIGVYAYRAGSFRLTLSGVGGSSTAGSTTGGTTTDGSTTDGSTTDGSTTAGTTTGGSNGELTLQPGQFATGSVARGEFVYYTVDNPAGVEDIIVELSDLTKDVDLYVRTGLTPSTSEFDCSSTRSSTSPEYCAVALDSGTNYIGVYGYRASGYTLTLRDATAQTSELGVAGTDARSLEQGEWYYYKISGLNAASDPQAYLAGLSADLDVYTNFGTVPTLNDYACRSTRSRTRPDACALPNNETRDVFVGVYAYQAGSYTLTINGVAIAAAEQIDVYSEDFTFEGKAFPGKWHYLELATKPGDRLLRVVLSGHSMPIDLFLSQDRLPGEDKFDCGPGFYNGKENVCEMRLAEGETENWFAGVYSSEGTPYHIEVDFEQTDNGNATAARSPIVVGGGGAAGIVTLLVIFLTLLRRRLSFDAAQGHKRRD